MAHVTKKIPGKEAWPRLPIVDEVGGNASGRDDKHTECDAASVGELLGRHQPRQRGLDRRLAIHSGRIGDGPDPLDWIIDQLRVDHGLRKPAVKKFAVLAAWMEARP